MAEISRILTGVTRDMPQEGEHTNLRVLKRSRKSIRPGDVFAFQPAGMPFFFGRVIRTDAAIGGFPNAILVYLYAVRSTNRNKIPELRRDELLLPPLATNRLPWTRGYFETLESRPLAESDILPTHCFRNSSGRYFDETGKPMDAPIEPVGEFALQSYRSIDDLVSDALGIERASD